MTTLPEVLVIGGTGAQGAPVVQALATSGRYRVKVLTRNTHSTQAKSLAALQNVTLFQGAVTSQVDLHAAFRGVYGAWVNTDGFTLGEKNEIFYGLRAYEIARHEKVTHFVWANSDYALRKAGWDERFRTHNDAKGRVGDLILAHGQQGMKSTLFTTGPYMNMLWDGMFVPRTDSDGTVIWENPAEEGKIPLIALEDVGKYTLWIFDHIDQSAGLDLEVATDQVSFQEIAETFTRVTGRPAVHRAIPMDQYMAVAEPYADAPVNWTAGDKATRDEATMTWKVNFTAWWRYWGGGLGATRDLQRLDQILPTRIQSLEDWMRKTQYDGKPRSVLKGLDDARSGSSKN